jgi:hypothetical protein
VFDRFRLRLSGRIGSRMRRSGANDSRSSGARPRVSAPNTNTSPGRNVALANGAEPCVVSANMRAGSGCVASMKASQFLCTFMVA